MSKTVTEYIYTDPDGDELRVRYTSDICMCSGGNCNSDYLEVQDSGTEDFYRLELDCVSEIKYLIQDLLERNCKKV